MIRSARRRDPVLHPRWLPVLGALVFALLLVCQPTVAASDLVGPEVSPAAKALLTKLDTGSKSDLLATEGLTVESVDKILAHRASGKRIGNLIQLRKVADLDTDAIETLLKPFQKAEEEKARAMARQRRAAEGPSRRFSGRKMASQREAQEGEQAKEEAAPGVGSEGDGPIGSVRPGYYGELPGFEGVDKLDPAVKKAFLERVNREMCPCGCKNETIAYCLVNDPGCPIVKARARKIYDDVTKDKSE